LQELIIHYSSTFDIIYALLLLSLQKHLLILLSYYSRSFYFLYCNIITKYRFFTFKIILNAHFLSPFGNLTITPLKDGSFTVRGFFKAENVKPLNRSFTLKIAE